MLISTLHTQAQAQAHTQGTTPTERELRFIIHKLQRQGGRQAKQWANVSYSCFLMPAQSF